MQQRAALAALGWRQRSLLLCCLAPALLQKEEEEEEEEEGRAAQPCTGALALAPMSGSPSA
jgi:hypothetical protein